MVAVKQKNNTVGYENILHMTTESEKKTLSHHRNNLDYQQDFSSINADLRNYTQALNGCEEFALFVMFAHCQNILVGDLKVFLVSF